MKKLAKIFLAVLLLGLAAIIGLTIYVRIKYPAERLRQLLISYLAEEYKIRVAVERLEFNLFSGFVLDKVAVLGAANDTISTRVESPLIVEKIKFAYRWRSLLARQLDIDEIAIERPIFFYRQKPDSASNLDALLAALVDSTQTPNDTSAAGLPVSIHLKTFHLENLQLKATLISAVDSQRVELGPVNLAVNELAFDRAANFSGKFELHAEPANLRYIKLPVEKGDPLVIMSQIPSQISGSFTGDSIALSGKLSFNQSQIKLADKTEFSLPQLGITAEIRYNFTSSQLAAPEIRVLIDNKEQLAARFEMNQQNGLSALALRVHRGVLDLAQLLSLAKAHTNGELNAFLQNLDCAGELEFSGSEFENTADGMNYQVSLRGRHLAYTNFVSGLKLNEGSLEATWKTNADSSAELGGKVSVTTFDLPIDTTQILKTGPVDLETNLAFAKDFFPQRGRLDLSWQNFSAGKIKAGVEIGPSNVLSGSGSWLSRLRGEAEITAGAIEMAPFTAGAAAGKISSKITLAGKRLDDVDLNFDWRNEKFRYATIDYKGHLPDYHLSASSNLIIDPSLTKFALSNGKLRLEPAQASFNAIYDLKADTFRCNLPNLNVDLAQVMAALPDTILASMNYATVKGRATGSGWLQGRFLEPDSLDYRGIFTLHSEEAAYADSVLGIYTDSLQINSEWRLAAASTVGEFEIACSAPKLPDYLRQPLPPTKAAGQLTIDETTFTISDGKFEIPDWRATGKYRVDGEFRPAGMQVKTTVDLGIHAPQPFFIDRGKSLRGDLDGQFIIDQYIPDELTAPQPSSLSGWLRIDGLDANIDTTLALQNIRADCRFNQNFALHYLPLDSTMAQGMKLEAENDLQPYLVLQPSSAAFKKSFNNAGEALLMYELFHDNGERSWLTINEINFLGYRLSNVAADLHLGNCRFDIPKFSMNLFDGNVVGNLLIGLSNGNPDSISYATNMQMASLDVSHFRRLSAELGGKQSRLSANFFLSGVGTAPKKIEEVVNNLAGQLNITKIENKVAANLLQTLDPNGTDKGIQNMRLLMKTRWNVKQLTFEIKSGFIYASLAHIKPWYAPFSLPQPIDFARFPVKPYLKTAAAE